MIEKGQDKRIDRSKRQIAAGEKTLARVDEQKKRLMARERRTKMKVDEATKTVKFIQAQLKTAAALRKRAETAPTTKPAAEKKPRAKKVAAAVVAAPEVVMVMSEPVPITAKEYEGKIKAEQKKLKRTMKTATPVDIAKMAVDNVSAAFRVM